MRSKTLVLTALALLTAGSLAAKDAAKATFTPSGELKWVDIPNTPAKMATVKGDSAKGAHASFIKLPGGFAAPMHSHTADHHVAVVAGTLTLTAEGGTEKTLPAGSWFEFTGKKKHDTKCAAGADCVLFIVSKGAWDLIPAEGAAKK